MDSANLIIALRYHPDRNPGREVEFNAKFQAIQAANEILSDPQQRLKYDTDRLRAGYGKAYGPPKTTQRKTQPASFASATPPPRTHNQKPSFNTRSHTTANGGSAGAQRYATHARAGAQQWSKPQDEAQTRADAFRAFHGMRGANTAGWRGFDPETGRATPSSGGTPRQQNTPFGNPRPKSAYEYFKENMKSQGPASPNSPKKRNGFAPGTAGGDEPMATNTSAYTNNRSARPSSMYFDSATPPTAKKPAAPDPPPFNEEPKRFSTSYATTGGEKTFFTSPGLGRSATGRTPSGSYRTSNSRTNPPSPVHGQHERHRSSSPKDRRNRTYSLSTSSSDLDDETDEEEVVEVPRPSGFKPKAVPKSRLRPNQKFADFYRHENSSSGTGEEPSTRPSAKDTRRAPPSANSGFRRPPPLSAFVDLTADSDGNKGHNSDSAAFPKGSYRPESQTQSPDLGARCVSPPTCGHMFCDSYIRYRPGQGQYTAGPQSSAFGRRSSGNLHKKFSAEDWRDHINTFDFLGASAKERSPHNQSRGRASNRTDSAQSGASTSPGLNPFASVPGGQQQPQQAPTPFAQAKFSADEWAEKLRGVSWATQETDKYRQSANTPPARSPKKQARSGTKVRSAPQPASVATEAEEANETVNGVPPEPSRSVPADAEAMDIDEPPAPPASAPVPETTATGVPGSASYPDLNAHVPQEPSSASKKTQPPQAEGVPNAETRIPLFDLDNLRRTAPFTSTNSGGIEDLEDVHATLPFESRAKQPTTTKRDIRPRDLKLPNPPKRPWAPQLVPAYPGSSQLVLHHDKWKYYVSAMGTYMHEWNAFNRRILLHFNSRQEAIETGLAPGWISAVGDTTKLRVNGEGEDGEGDKSGIHEDADIDQSDDSLVPGGKGGFSAYLRGIEEDIKVRKHWEVACEMHRECILDLGRLREWIRNGGKVV